MSGAGFPNRLKSIHRGKRWRFAMAAAIALRGDCDSGQLRELAKQSEDADQVRTSPSV
jgi:hypothetical protein